MHRTECVSGGATKRENLYRKTLRVRLHSRQHTQ